MGDVNSGRANEDSLSLPREQRRQVLAEPGQARRLRRETVHQSAAWRDPSAEA